MERDDRIVYVMGAIYELEQKLRQLTSLVAWTFIVLMIAIVVSCAC